MDQFSDFTSWAWISNHKNTLISPWSLKQSFDLSPITNQIKALQIDIIWIKIRPLEELFHQVYSLTCNKRATLISLQFEFFLIVYKYQYQIIGTLSWLPILSAFFVCSKVSLSPFSLRGLTLNKIILNSLFVSQSWRYYAACSNK